MNLRKVLMSGLLITIIAGFITSGALSAHGQDTPFPSYGSGSIQVRLYTDYFCPPCRGMEPALEPVLLDLVKRNRISLTLVDVPFSSNTPLYARYFLYALKAKNDFDHALKVRNILFAATTNRQNTSKEKIEELFRSKGIPYATIDPKPAFDQYNALIKEDKIDQTPSGVIVRSGKKETFVGGADIIQALKRLK